MNLRSNRLVVFLVAALALLVVPFAMQHISMVLSGNPGNAWVRIVDIALLYVLLALGLNIVVGYAGLLDLGYVAFYAVGAYMFGLLASPHLASTFPWIAQMFPNGIHTPLLLVVPLGALLAGAAGVLLGAPTLKLRGDYLAIVTLGFGEIVRVFMNNLDAPVNITNGPKGLSGIDEIKIPFTDFSLGTTHEVFGLEFPKVTNYYYLFVILVVLAVVICYRLERSRIGRAWMAIREDEVAAKAMGINTRNLKLLAFGMGATFGGVAGVMFASFQSFISPESFSLQESIMIVAMVVLGGIGHLPGVIVGALLLAALPEVLRYVAGPLQQMTDGRLDAAILRQLLVALAMIGIMLARPRGLWPSPEHGRALPQPKVGAEGEPDPALPQPVASGTSAATNDPHPSGTRHA
ncbi:branched-chain amino acid ABC transporter permease [Piscinibacter koreensis]|uniref:ABC transporter ATP-binding protein n=1 Tax=Piscinibacter koreensis TaxID=2742824 RepID=A0A7Y6NLT5_9BURK|nr:ABC transporter ATP-binding protein [Schlegelella koreensis]NUZ05469.1 ABC transporter ATP-binding protein [Schlegelella koreensis]